MERFLGQPCDPSLLSPLTLAFVGDCVFELFVREQLVCGGNCPVKKLHARAVEQVCCSAQNQAVNRIFPLLEEKEREVFLRGRNAHVGHVPKNASPAEYHGATGLEALFGYLYLEGKLDRLRQLFSAMQAAQTTEAMQAKKK